MDSGIELKGSKNLETIGDVKAPRFDGLENDPFTFHAYRYDRSISNSSCISLANLINAHLIRGNYQELTNSTNSKITKDSVMTSSRPIVRPDSYLYIQLAFKEMIDRVSNNTIDFR